MRCNHCDDAPCVTICPTTALYQRADGIVDFDGDRCIGCKSCMQACPYDALYIDPDTNTAAKCHFCAHRVEVGLRAGLRDRLPGAGHHRRRPRRPAQRDRAHWSPASRSGAQAGAGHAPEGLLHRRRRRRADAGRCSERPATFMFGQRPAAEADLLPDGSPRSRGRGARRRDGTAARAHRLRRAARRAAVGLEGRRPICGPSRSRPARCWWPRSAGWRTRCRRPIVAPCRSLASSSCS